MVFPVRTGEILLSHPQSQQEEPGQGHTTANPGFFMKSHLSSLERSVALLNFRSLTGTGSNPQGPPA